MISTTTRWVKESQASESQDDIFLLEKSKIDDINARVRTFTNYLEGPGKDVRDVGPEGFTRKDLEDELEYLELPDVFPNIKDHVELVYNHVVKEKKQEVLRTCDMFEALKHCQLLSFLQKFPKVSIYLLEDSLPSHQFSVGVIRAQSIRMQPSSSQNVLHTSGALHLGRIEDRRRACQK